MSSIAAVSAPDRAHHEWQRHDARRDRRARPLEQHGRPEPAVDQPSERTGGREQGSTQPVTTGGTTSGR